MLKTSIFVWSRRDQKQQIFMKKEDSSILHSNLHYPSLTTLQHPSITSLFSNLQSLHNLEPFNHSTFQHPSIIPLSSTLQSLTFPAPFNHSPLQHPSTHLGLYELTLRRQPCHYQHCTSFHSQVICKKPNMICFCLPFETRVVN